MVKFTSNCSRKFQKDLFFLKFLQNFYFTKIKNIFKLKACSSGDRASDSDSESQGFDSLHAYELPFFKSSNKSNFEIELKIAKVVEFPERKENQGGCFGFDI